MWSYGRHLITLHAHRCRTTSACCADDLLSLKLQSWVLQVFLSPGFTTKPSSLASRGQQWAVFRLFPGAWVVGQAGDPSLVCKSKKCVWPVSRIYAFLSLVEPHSPLCNLPILIFSIPLIYCTGRFHSSPKYLTSRFAPVLDHLSPGFACTFLKASWQLHKLMCRVEVISLCLRVSFSHGLEVRLVVPVSHSSLPLTGSQSSIQWARYGLCTWEDWAANQHALKGATLLSLPGNALCRSNQEFLSPWLALTSFGH